jgi:hypothetical protein
MRRGDLVRLRATGETGRITDVQQWQPPGSLPPARWLYWVSVRGQRPVNVWGDELDEIPDPTRLERRG